MHRKQKGSYEASYVAEEYCTHSVGMKEMNRWIINRTIALHLTGIEYEQNQSKWKMYDDDYNRVILLAFVGIPCKMIFLSIWSLAQWRISAHFSGTLKNDCLILNCSNGTRMIENRKLNFCDMH